MPKELKQDRAIATRQTLLAGAGRVFADKHYSAATLADVLTTADVSQGSLYFHFRNKHELALAVIGAQGAAMQQVREEVLHQTNGPWGALLETARSVAALVAESPIVQGGIRLLVQSRDEFPEVSVDPYQMWFSFVEAQYERAARDGQLRADVTVRDAAWLFVSAFMGTKEVITYWQRWAELPTRAEANASMILRATLLDDLQPVARHEARSQATGTRE